MVLLEEYALELTPDGPPVLFGALFVEMENQFREEDFTPLFGEFQETLREEHAGYFANQAGPEGPWPALAPSTVAKKGFDTILVETGDLAATLTGIGGDAIREVFSEGDTTGLVFGTSDPKSLFHQEPKPGGLPERKHVGMTEPVLQGLVDGIADQMVEALKL